MIRIFIFNNNASRAASYGVGTYVRQLSDGLLAMPNTTVSLVEIYADTQEFSVKVDNCGRTHYLIPSLSAYVESEAYLRSIFYFIAGYMQECEGDTLVFQFNYFGHYLLAKLLKARFPHCKVVLTVHYMDWCFELHGNVRQMRKITAIGNEPSDEMEERVLSSFINEKLFLHLSDAVLVLSKQTMKILVKDYKVMPNKIHLVYNGIADGNNKSYVENNDTRYVVFVGRLDEIKGLKYLIDAFAQIANKHLDTQLIIVGDGDFQPYMIQCRKLLGRVAFLGKMQNDEVEDVYASAYIGVMPSFHEQCSYTAIEMMRHGIPIIGTDSTGLGEMLDATPALRITIDEEKFDEENFVTRIALQLDLLLSDEAIYQQTSKAVSKLYEERYTVAGMIAGVQKALSIISNTADRQVSSDYLPHIDDYMIDLINRQPDIDMGFYGLSGIGVYLWWRVLQLETRKDVANACQLALIKEHLIYYLDWIEEVAKIEALSAELSMVLVDMKNHSFFLTKVENILKYSKSFDGEVVFPSEQVILQNALKICTCKI